MIVAILSARTFHMDLHDTLCAQSLWLWKVGCIENATGYAEKGEEAILAQELAIESMDAQAIEATMPEIGCCFDWLDGLRRSPTSGAA